MYSQNRSGGNTLSPSPEYRFAASLDTDFASLRGAASLSFSLCGERKKEVSAWFFLFLLENLSHAGLTFDFQHGGMNYSFKRARANVIDIPVFVLRRARAIRLQFSPTCSWEERACVGRE
jgi:hypothetical protein